MYSVTKDWKEKKKESRWLFETILVTDCQVPQSTEFPSKNAAAGCHFLLQEYTEELYKKDLHDPHNHDGVITIALISHTSKVMLKILQARLWQYVNCELPDVQAGFRKGRGTRDQTTNISWIIEKAREFQKNIYFCFIDYAKAFDCVDYNKLWKILKEMGKADHLICLLRNLCRSRSNWTWNNRLVPNRERSTSRQYIFTLLI